VPTSVILFKISEYHVVVFIDKNVQPNLSIGRVEFDINNYFRDTKGISGNIVIFFDAR